MEMLKEKINDKFEKKPQPKYELIQLDTIDCREDPVRPELDL